MTSIYEVKRIREINLYDKYYGFFLEEVGNVQPYRDKFDFRSFDLPSYAWNNFFWVCNRNDLPVGVLMARLYGSVFDPYKKILYQDLLYAKKSSGKAVHLLLREFIDFGRVNASLVFTCRTIHTNIKDKSLEKLGFKKAEELYLLGE